MRSQSPSPSRQSPRSSREGIWTTRRLLAWIGETLAERGIDSPRLSAEMLLAHVLSCERLDLYTDPDRPATPQERSHLRELVARSLNHEPIQYLVGTAWFFGLPLQVNSDVLVPRPATETLVEAALRWLRDFAAPQESDAQQGPLFAADVGSGSGAIAIALARNCPALHILAIDRSPEALSVMTSNAERHDVLEQVHAVQGDLLQPIAVWLDDQRAAANQTPRLDLLVSNPPYISDAEWDQVPPNVRNHEPTIALRGGEDGLDLIRPLLRDGPALLRPGGLLLIEHAASHADQVREMALCHDQLSTVETLTDLEGHPRVQMATRS